MKRYARPLLAVVFLLMLATPAIIRRYANAGLEADAGLDSMRYGFRLSDASQAAGLALRHEAPTLDAQLAHIMPRCRFPT
jgi:hypothetical protein